MYNLPYFDILNTKKNEIGVSIIKEENIEYTEMYEQLETVVINDLSFALSKLFLDIDD